MERNSRVKRAHTWAVQGRENPGKKGAGEIRTPGFRVLRIGSSRDG